MTNEGNATDDGSNDGSDNGPASRRASEHRRKAHSEPRQPLWTRPWEETPAHLMRGMKRDVVVDCGWGRLVFAQTFDEAFDIIKLLRAEEAGRRDIAMYVADPHVLISQAPDELFIDPSLTYRLEMHRYRPRRNVVPGVFVRTMSELADADEINRIYTAHGMVTADPELMWANQRTRTFTYLVAQDDNGDVVGAVTGIDHALAFDDPDNGASLWSLAVDPLSTVPGVGEALVRVLVEHYIGRTRNHLDLSVIHDNDPAIRLYKKLGFRRVPVFTVKRKNPINEPLFVAEPEGDFAGFNPYARIIADEARRRGIMVEATDVESGEMLLTHGGRRIVTRESLSELTTAVAMSRCDDKLATRRIFERSGLNVAKGQLAGVDDADQAFLDDVGELVVKPVRGEQGRGITVGVRTTEALTSALEYARSYSADVLLEEYVQGDDLRIIVIGHEIVAAAVRRPATVHGTGIHTVAQLIEAHSRRRAAATEGESRIPVDDTTVETIEAAGHTLDSVLPDGEKLRVRRTANLHTGGTIHDVTANLHPALAEAATTASRAIDIPVTGLDMIITAPDQPEYVLIEANERPGLANHEPQPTAAAFIDLLFPATSPTPRAWNPAPPGSSAST